jgi:hypothetical protein
MTVWECVGDLCLVQQAGAVQNLFMLSSKFITLYTSSYRHGGGYSFMSRAVWPVLHCERKTCHGDACERAGSAHNDAARASQKRLTGTRADGQPRKSFSAAWCDGCWCARVQQTTPIAVRWSLETVRNGDEYSLTQQRFRSSTRQLRSACRSAGSSPRRTG